MVLTPIVLYCLFIQQWLVALVLFSIAVLSDFFDGFCARLFNRQTRLGAFLDHAADKFLMIGIFSMLLMVPHAHMPAWFCWLVLIKEGVLLGATGMLMIVGRVRVVAPLFVGKLVMAGQMFVVWWWLLTQCMPALFPVLMLWIMTGMIIVSMLVYICVGIKLLFE
jgi:phosphatidylglycerophosphate synthase